MPTWPWVAVALEPAAAAFSIASPHCVAASFPRIRSQDRATSRQLPPCGLRTAGDSLAPWLPHGGQLASGTPCPFIEQRVLVQGGSGFYPVAPVPSPVLSCGNKSF